MRSIRRSLRSLTALVVAGSALVIPGTATADSLPTISFTDIEVTLGHACILTNQEGTFTGTGGDLHVTFEGGCTIQSARLYKMGSTLLRDLPELEGSKPFDTTVNLCQDPDRDCKVDWTPPKPAVETFRGYIQLDLQQQDRGDQPGTRQTLFLYFNTPSAMAGSAAIVTQTAPLPRSGKCRAVKERTYGYHRYGVDGGWKRIYSTMAPRKSNGALCHRALYRHPRKGDWRLI